MGTLFTHTSPDLDSICSSWLWTRIISPNQKWDIRLVPANWDGKGLGYDEKQDVALDITAGGAGIKGNKDDCCFNLLVGRLSDIETKRALYHLSTWVHAQDCHGYAPSYLGVPSHVQGTINAVSIGSVLRALQTSFNDDMAVVKIFFSILDGMLKNGMSHHRAREEAKDIAEPFGKVAIVRNAQEFGTNSQVFKQGFEIIVYVDGMNLGMIREKSSPVMLNSKAIIEFIQSNGESWFHHPDGFMCSHGSRKAPAQVMSKVSPEELALFMKNLLD